MLLFRDCQINGFQTAQNFQTKFLQNLRTISQSCMYNLVTSQSLLTTGEKGHAQYVDPPVIPGHEFFGEVVKLGKGTYVYNLRNCHASHVQ